MYIEYKKELVANEKKMKPGREETVNMRIKNRNNGRKKKRERTKERKRRRKISHVTSQPDSVFGCRGSLVTLDLKELKAGPIAPPR